MRLLLCSRPFFLKIMIISLFSLRAFCHYHVMPVFLQYVLQQDYKTIGGMENDKEKKWRGVKELHIKPFSETAGCRIMLFDKNVSKLRKRLVAGIALASVLWGHISREMCHWWHLEEQISRRSGLKIPTAFITIFLPRLVARMFD